MTPQEALKVLGDTHFFVNNEAEEQKCRVYQAAFKTAIQALEKQIPKKPILVETKCFDGSTADFVFVCPVCNRKICSEPTDDVMASFLKEDYPHCNCGQALDWSGTE